MSRSLLEVEGLEVSYGRLPALRGVDLAVPEGSVVGLLGPNGSGKSTLLRAVAGLVPPRSGEVRLRGERISGRAPHEVSRLGVCLIPEGRGIFPELSVADNLRLALDGYHTAKQGRVVEFFPVLGKRGSQLAGTLSGGEQQMLALARAVGVDSALLMADELSLGLAPKLVDAIYEGVARLKEEGGRTLLLVEQYASHVLRLADLVYVLGGGRVVWAGEPSELRASGVLVQSYLGG